MPVIYQKWIERDDLQRNPQIKYLFGDNLLRKGLGGQARAMRGEPNAIGVATKRAPGRRAADYFSDAAYEELVEIIDLDLAPAKLHIALDGILIIPTDGLGTGLSELPQRAPRLARYIDDQLALIQSMTKEPL